MLSRAPRQQIGSQTYEESTPDVMSINYNEDAGETAGTMELDIEFNKSYSDKKLNNFPRC